MNFRNDDGDFDVMDQACTLSLQAVPSEILFGIMKVRKS
jgi:hypothetical protein